MFLSHLNPVFDHNQDHNGYLVQSLQGLGHICSQQLFQTFSIPHLTSEVSVQTVNEETLAKVKSIPRYVYLQYIEFKHHPGLPI